jgi:hypothetical protein
MTESFPSPARAPFIRVAGIGWLVFVSAFALIDHITLSHVEVSPRGADSDHAEVVALQGRVAALERTVESFKHPPASITPAMLEAIRSELSERLGSIEQLSKTAASKDDLASLADRLSALETRFHRFKQTQQPTRIDSTPTSTASAPEPPFAVLGVELRGGERFVSIAPFPVGTLKQVRLVRVGAAVPDVSGDWRLEALDGATAVFESAGHRVRINIP